MFQEVTLEIQELLVTGALPFTLRTFEEWKMSMQTSGPEEPHHHIKEAFRKGPQEDRTKIGDERARCIRVQKGHQDDGIWSSFPDPEATACHAFLQLWSKKGLYL